MLSVFRSKRKQSSTRVGKRRRGRRYVPRPERLEDRRLLAANINAVVDASGNVNLSGTSNQDDSAIIYVDEFTDEVFVEGIDGTTINGGTDPVRIGEDSTIAGNLFVFLSGGDNHFVVGGLEPAGVAPTLGPLVVEGNMTVYANGGADDVGVENTDVGGDLKIFATGDDNVILVHGTYVGTDDGGDLYIQTSKRDDYIAICYSEVHGDFDARTNKGEDTVINVGVYVHGDTRIITKTDNQSDTVLLNNSIYWGSTTVTMKGNSDDSLFMSRNEFVGALDVHMGPGNDKVVAVRNEADSSVDIDGQGGVDEIYRRLNDGVGDTDIVGFATDVQGDPIPDECLEEIDDILDELYLAKWWVFGDTDDVDLPT